MKNITGTITNDLFQHGANHIGDTNETNTIMSINERLNEISHYLGILSQHSYVFHDQINSANQSLLIQSQQLDMIQKTSDNTAREVFAIDKKIQALLRFQLEQSKITIQLAQNLSLNPSSKIDGNIEEQINNLRDSKLQATNEIGSDKHNSDIGTGLNIKSHPLVFLEMSENQNRADKNNRSNGYDFHQPQTPTYDTVDDINDTESFHHQLQQHYPDLGPFQDEKSSFLSRQLDSPASNSIPPTINLDATKTAHTNGLVIPQKKHPSMSSLAGTNASMLHSSRNDLLDTKLLNTLKKNSTDSSTSSSTDSPTKPNFDTNPKPISSLEKDSFIKPDLDTFGKKRRYSTNFSLSDLTSPKSQFSVPDRIDTVGPASSTKSTAAGSGRRRGRPPGRLNNSTLLLRQQVYSPQRQNQFENKGFSSNGSQEGIGLGLGSSFSMASSGMLQLSNGNNMSQALLDPDRDDNSHRHSQSLVDTDPQDESMLDPTDADKNNVFKQSEADKSFDSDLFSKQMMQKHPNALYYELKIEEIKTLNSFKDAYLEFFEGIRGNPSIQDQEIYIRNTFGTHYFIQLKQGRSFRRRKTLVTFIEKVKKYYNCDVNEACRKLERFKQTNDKTISWVCNHLPNVEDLA